MMHQLFENVANRHSVRSMSGLLSKELDRVRCLDTVDCRMFDHWKYRCEEQSSTRKRIFIREKVFRKNDFLLTIQLNLNGRTIRFACWPRPEKWIEFPPRIGVSSKPNGQSSLVRRDISLALSIFGLTFRRQNRINVRHVWRQVKKPFGPWQQVPLVFKPFELIKCSNSISNWPALKQN